MGQVKQFAVWIAECVYVRRMSDQKIFESIPLTGSEQEQDPIIHWLREQITTVREHPDIFSQMVGECYPPESDRQGSHPIEKE